MLEAFLKLLGGAASLAVLGWFLWPRAGLISRFRRGRRYERKELREDALKYLFKAEKDGTPATLEGLAGVIGIDTDAASQVLTELEAVGLIDHREGRPHLTPTGQEYALHIIRAHRLWERYLADRTGFGQIDWHREAEVKEHLLTPDDVADLQQSLGHPTHDPHGDPIPNTTAEAVSPEGRPLTDAPLRVPLRIVHVEDEPEAIYVQILAHELHPGTLLEIEEKTSTAVTFWADGRERVLAPLVADNLLVAPAEPSARHGYESRPSLADVPVGGEAVIGEISPAIRGLERRRLFDLGLLPGTTVQVEMESPGGDPIAYRVRGAIVALRRSQTGQIFLEPRNDAAPGESS
jgi:DtxR family Mn-dependent transcriptional regulator